MDVLTNNMKGRICIHEQTGQPCIVLGAEWTNCLIQFTVFVPHHDKKGELVFTAAKYSNAEQ